MILDIFARNFSKGETRNAAAQSRRDRLQRLQREMDVLEVRQLLAMTPVQIAGFVNKGFDALRESANSEKLVAAADLDIPEVVLLKDQPLAALRLNETFLRAVPKNISRFDTIETLRADLVSRGLNILYLGSEVDSKGRYLVAGLKSQTLDVKRNPVLGGSEGFSYLVASSGNFDGKTIKASMPKVDFDLTFVVTDQGFFLASGGRVSGTFEMAGLVDSQQKLGVLDMNVKGTVRFDGAFELALADDGDGLLTTTQITQNKWVEGKLKKNSNMSFEPTVTATVAGVKDIRWNASFQASYGPVAPNLVETIGTPNYAEIVQKAGGSLIVDMKSTAWFQRVDTWIKKKLPLVDKSIHEILKLDSVPGGWLEKVANLRTLEGQAAQSAMNDLVRGKIVDLVTIDVSGSANIWKDTLYEQKLGEWSLIPEFISAEVWARLTSGLDFVYSVFAGLNTKGTYVRSDSQVGLKGYLNGELSGEGKVFGFNVAKVSGGATLDVTLNATLFDSDRDGKVYFQEIRVNPASTLGSKLDVGLSLYAKAKVKVGPFSKTIFKTSKQIAKLYEANISPISNIGIEDRKEIILKSLDLDPENWPEASALPSAPTGMKVSGITKTGATISWSQQPSLEFAFVVETSKDGGRTWQEAGFTNEKTRTLSLTGLTAGTNYMARVRSVNTKGYSNATQVSFKTK
jgi:hypothetical protein